MYYFNLISKNTGSSFLYKNWFAFLTFVLVWGETHAQFDVVLGTHNVPIKRVTLIRNDTLLVQTSGNQSVIATDDVILIDTVTIMDNGATKQLIYANTEGAYISNNNFLHSTRGVGVYNGGTQTSSTDRLNWETAMSDVFCDKNMLNYLFYDATTNTPAGPDFDIRWVRASTNNDYFVVSERDGNTHFTVTPLDSLGNVITGARELRFGSVSGTASPNGNRKYDWNLRYSSAGRFPNQPQYMTVIPITLFNTSSNIYGFRIDNNGDADVKFYALSETSFDNNPRNPRIPALRGNVFLDGNGLVDSTVNGPTINKPGSNEMYVSLLHNGNVFATTKVNSIGSYEFFKIPSGSYSVVLHPIVGGSSTPSLPVNWVNTGENHGASAGNDGSSNGVYPGVVIYDSLETQLNFGIQQRPISHPKSFFLTASPHISETRFLYFSTGMGPLSGTDNEDGTHGNGSDFIIHDTTGMNGNFLFYDKNKDGLMTANELLKPSDTIQNYDSTLLGVVFNGLHSTGFAFRYSVIDGAGTTDTTPAPYLVAWPVALPTSWLSITVSKLAKNKAQIYWKVASENNVKSYDVERKSSSDWTKIGDLKALGSNQTPTAYSFMDKNPKENNFYRIKMLYLNGTYEYSRVLHFDNTPDATLKIYPNPVANELTITFNNDEGTEHNVKIMDGLGKEVLSIRTLSSRTTLGLGTLNPGVYNLFVDNRVFTIVKH